MKQLEIPKRLFKKWLVEFGDTWEYFNKCDDFQQRAFVDLFLEDCRRGLVEPIRR